MGKLLVGLVVVFTTLVGVKPAAAAPAWCHTEDLVKAGVKTRFDAGTALKEDWGALEAIVKTLCVPDDDAQRVAAKIEANRVKLSKKLGMTDEDWADIAQIVADGNSVSTGTSFEYKEAFPDGKYLGIASLTPLQQYYVIRTFLPSGENPSLDDRSYFLDALGPKVSEFGKMAYAIVCIKAQPHPTSYQLAMCVPDARSVDRKKLAQEIRSAKVYASQKMKMRFAVLEFFDVLPDLDKEIKYWTAFDPAYAKMLDIGTKVRADWEQVWKTETKALDAALAMDDARETKSKKAHEGCSDTTWAAFKEVVAAMPASKFVTTKEADWGNPVLTVALSSPRAYLASVALASCEKEDQDGLISSLHSTLGNLPGMRGPRLATWQAIIDTNLSLDTQGETISYGIPSHSKRFYGRDNSARSGYAFGTVTKIGKPDDKGLVEVTFATKTESREECVSSKTTNRISHWLSDGSPVYYYTCLKYGVVKHDQTPKPTKVNKRYLDGLKPGTTTVIINEVPFVVFPKGGKKTPAAVLGVIVK